MKPIYHNSNCPECKGLGSKVVYGYLTKCQVCKGWGYKRSKYGAIKTELDGMMFDSRKEARVYARLKQEQQAGLIFDLQVKTRYPLIVEGIRKIKMGYYEDDFNFVRDGAAKRTVLDVKGKKTAMYLYKKKLMLALYDIEIEEE